MTRWTLNLLAGLACFGALLPAWAGLSEEQLARHWDEPTRDAARQATLALAIWLEDESADPRQWQARVEANRLALAAAARRVPTEQLALADGLFAWLVQSRSPGALGDGLALPWNTGLDGLLRPTPQAGRLARLQKLMAIEAPAVWSALRRRLEAAPAPLATEIDPLIDPAIQADQDALPVEDIDIDGEIAAYWAALLRPVPPQPPPGHPEIELAASDATADAALVTGESGASASASAQAPEAVEDPAQEAVPEQAGSSDETREAPERLEPPEPSPYAREQAGRVLAWTAAEDDEEQRRLLVDIIRAQAAMEWSSGHRLAAVWSLLHALAETAVLAGPAPTAAELVAQLAGYNSDSGRELRVIDTDLPVVLALLEDAAIQLAADPTDRTGALQLLSDAYARLALFAGDAEFYLDQPVRDEVNATMAICTIDQDLVGPLPRSLFEDCLQRLAGQMGEPLGRVELVGDSGGPFSSVFLQREMGLISWQRIAYLDGHLNWLLGASCSPPAWQNPLEWSLLAHYLSRWVAQRPVFFDSPRWREAVDAFERQARAQREASILFIDCLSGLGSERLDPVLRLIDRHQQALVFLDEALQEAKAAFYAEVTRPQADIVLDSDSTQLTRYRPEDLTIGPCEEAEVCGVTAQLSVSRALLSEFPNAFLLADQLKLGQLDLCYSDVRWEDRQARSVANNDPRVANYFGHLSFDLVGTFERAGQTQTVFRHRLRSTEARHYLFASSLPEVLEMDCPNALAGQPIASELAEGHLGLVPNRLTYFVSQPTTARAEMLANWDQGAEWRDWFVTGGRVEKIVISEGAELAVEVDAELDRLARQRDRDLSARLLSRLSPTQSAPDALTAAMSTVAENTALLRRVLEIHYPRVIRQDPIIRGLLAGEGGLLNRDRVRQLSDTEIGFGDIVGLGRSRLDRLRAHWSGLPVELRESGQVSPELDFAAERLDDLRRLSRSWLEGGESSPAP
jgi:hypothetical protein